MPILINDESGGVTTQLLQIDNNGQLCLGTGTPLAKLTASGTGLCDASGNLLTGVASTTLAPGSGTVVLGSNQYATVYTVSGFEPNVWLAAYFPATRHTYNTVNKTWSTAPRYKVSHQVDYVGNGNFEVMSNDLWVNDQFNAATYPDVSYIYM
ncbi:MAG TPA: hypothetical protein VM554_16220 [Acidisarcina sp.]|nr:hypothetical protein [Acidisarcina sp.]